MKKYNKNSNVTYKTPDIYTDFITGDDIVFEEHHVYIDNEFKYIVALFQDGDIYADDEIWGTWIIDIESIDDNGYCNAMTYDFYIGDPALTIRNDFILNNEWKPDIQISLNRTKLNKILKLWKYE